MNCIVFLVISSALVLPHWTHARRLSQSVVYPKLLRGRSQNDRPLLVINDQLHLKLSKSTVFPERFLFSGGRDNPRGKVYMNGRDLEKDLYHDSEHMASLMVSEEGELRVEGIIGSNLRIRPLESMERSSDGNVGGHLLYRVEERSPHDHDVLSDQHREERATLISPEQAISSVPEARDAHEVPHLDVEAAVWVDTEHSKAFHGDKSEDRILRYFAVFINSVNLKFQTLPYVDVKVILSAVEILSVQDESHFVSLLNNQRDLMVAGETLYNFTLYSERIEKKLENFDVVAIVTGRDLVRRQSDNTPFRGVSGLAHIGTVCSKLYKGALVEDFPRTYDGVLTFTHELGHLLGCVHDGQGPYREIQGHPGAKECAADKKQVMSPYSSASSKTTFSWCCGRAVHLVYQNASFACLRKGSSETIRKNNDLPGDSVLPDKLCKLEYPEVAGARYAKEEYWEKLRDECNVVCEVPRSDGGKSYRAYPAGDGTPCDDDKVCINAECRHYQKGQKIRDWYG